MIWLTTGQIEFLHSDIIEKTGGTSGLRDENLLLSALASPLQSFDGAELFPSAIDKIARLAFGLTKNHPFIDGNKRIGAHSMLVLLSLNGIKLKYSQKELSDLFLSIAADKSSFNDVKLWIMTHIING